MSNQSDPAVQAAAAAWQQAQRQGQSPGECLVIVARVYQQHAGKPLPGAPTGAALDASAGFHAEVIFIHFFVVNIQI